MWKYESSNHHNISLHDNLIDEIIMEGENIIFIFNDGFDIVKTHPLNQTGKSKHTTKAQIMLKNAQFLSGEVYYFKLTQNIDFSRLISHFDEFEVLQFNNENNIFKLFGNLKTTEFINDFAELLFYCSDALFCWNDYASYAWFEGWPKRSE